MIIRTIHAKGIQIYVERDKEGYISLSTDGWQRSSIAPIIKAIEALQTDDDREMDDLASLPHPRSGR